MMKMNKSLKVGKGGFDILINSLIREKICINQMEPQPQLQRELLTIT